MYIPNTFEENAELCALHCVEGIGMTILKEIEEKNLSPRDVLTMPESQLSLWLRPRIVTGIVNKRKEDYVATYSSYVNQRIRFIPFGTKEYPRRLTMIPSPPKSIYTIGSLPPKTMPTVAVIGARLCSDYGRYMAHYYGAGLASRGVGVISGMADGIDGIAQRAALKAGGYSLGVLGCGVDKCYPSGNRDLYDMLTETGCLVSEYPPGTAAKSSLFPPRNRIISALSDALLVVEARKKSGTAITVEMAIEQGKEIWAVPGRANEVLSAGCNALIREGAGIANSLEDFLDDLGAVFSIWKAGEMGETRENETEGAAPESMVFGAKGNPVLSILKNRSLTADEIAAELSQKGDGLSKEELPEILLELQLNERIVMTAGRYALA